MATASMLKYIDDPGADPRWLKVVVPGSNGGKIHAYELEVALHPLSLPASKQVQLVQQIEDIVVTIDRSCIFAPDIWGHPGPLCYTPQPQGTYCPCHKCQVKNACKPKERQNESKKEAA